MASSGAKIVEQVIEVAPRGTGSAECSQGHLAGPERGLAVFASMVGI